MRRLLAHLAGDFLLQSDWMAAAKVIGHGRERALAAASHAAIYAACFVPFTRNPARLAVIGVTHALIDAYRPLPWLIHHKDRLLSPRSWPAAKPSEVPWWLMIVTDQVVHLLINELALDTWRDIASPAV